MDNTSSNEMEINEKAFPVRGYAGNPQLGKPEFTIGSSAPVGKTIEDRIEATRSKEELEKLQDAAFRVESGRREYMKQMRKLMQHNTSL